MAPPRPARPDPESDRRAVGAALYVLFMMAGAAGLGFLFLVAPLASPDPIRQYHSMAMGALFALPPLAVYVWIPRVIDRFDPEPWWALALVLAWGGIAACGIAATINTGVELIAADIGGKSFAAVMGACVSAPIVEEGLKGLGVLGVFYFLRREFDGVVDGVIYATFTALGFAAVENVVYYGNALRASGGDALAATFLLRGVLAPWGHPLYTSMTGIGFGIARETSHPWLRWVAPLGGYFGAMVLHCVWNTAATISGFLTLLMLPLWLAFVTAFLGILIGLVVRKGRIIRAHLQDEVLMGNLTREELDLVVSPFASWRATFSWGGAAGRRFVRTASRLALSKWHAARARVGRQRTVSADWIVPLRQELFGLRDAMAQALARPLPMPRAWEPGPSAYGGQVPPVPPAPGPLGGWHR